MSINSYKDLLIWQKGIDLAVDVYSLTGDFPEVEKFALSSQIKRAASSIPARLLNMASAASGVGGSPGRMTR